MTLAHLQATGWLARRDPRLRVGAALLFVLVAIGLRHSASAALALAFALGLTWAAGVHPLGLIRRLLGLEGLLIILVLTLPLSTPGTCALALGSLCASSEGLQAALLILLKVNAAVIGVAALIGTLEPAVLGQALSQLRVPAKLTQMMLLTIRQIDLTQAEFERLQQALRARAFVPRTDLHTWRTYGWLIGMLLVRSHHRAQRLLAAMRCRGFQGRFYRLDTLCWTFQDTLAASILPLPLLALYWLDICLSTRGFL